MGSPGASVTGMRLGDSLPSPHWGKIGAQSALEKRELGPCGGRAFPTGRSPSLLNHGVQACNYHLRTAGGCSGTLSDLPYHPAHTRHQKKRPGVIDNCKAILISVPRSGRDECGGVDGARARGDCIPHSSAGVQGKVPALGHPHITQGMWHQPLDPPGQASWGLSGGTEVISAAFFS